MKFAIGSDFHLDINQDQPFNLAADKDAERGYHGEGGEYNNNLIVEI